MVNRFQHEINIMRHFANELERYLDGDDLKEREALESKLLDLEIDHKDIVAEKDDEIRDLRLQVARSALERGKILQRLDKYEPIDDDGLTYKRRTKEELREMAEKEVARQRSGKNANQLMDETLRIAESDATGKP